METTRRLLGTATALSALIAGARASPGQDDVLDHRTVRTVHLDVVGRPPYERDYRFWVGKSPGELRDALLSGREFWDHWYEEQLYYFLLLNNFRPESERAAAISGDLHAGRIGVRDAIHRIALTSSFDHRNPGADTFVTVVMEQLCGLEVQKIPRELEIAKKIYDGAPGAFLGSAGRCQADVVRIAIESRLFVPHLLAREHERLVHARADPKDLAAWASRLQTDPSAYLPLVRAWLSGDAYRARLDQPVPQPNRLYVRSLFVDLMDRLPTTAEAEPLREALDGLADPTPLRSILARMLLDSGKAGVPARKDIADPAEWVRGLFLRLLGRAATDAELEVFAAALAEPECRPSTVVCAVVSSPEYARY